MGINLRKNVGFIQIVVCAASMVFVAALPWAWAVQDVITVWVTDDLARVQPNSPIQTSNAIWNGTQVSLFSAKNEFTAFQTFVTAGSIALNNVNISISDLTSGSNVLLAANYNKYEGNPSVWSGHIKIYKEQYVKTTDGGLWPDPLIPFDATLYGMPMNVSMNTTQGFWIDIRVPANQPAGTYTGSLTVTSSQGNRTIPISLTIYNFALSNTNSAPYFFVDTVPEQVAQREGLTNKSADHRSMSMKYHERFAAWRISPKDTWPANPRYDVSFSGNMATINWSNTDTYGDTLVNQYKINLFEILLDNWKPNNIQDSSCAIGSACWQARAKSYLSQAWQHYKEKGWDKMAFVYPWATDEPFNNPDKFAKVFIYGDLINSVSTELPYLVTAPTDDYWWDEGHTNPSTNPDYRNWAGGRTLWEVVDWWIASGRQTIITEYMNGSPDVVTCANRKPVKPPTGGNKCGFYGSGPPFAGWLGVNDKGLGFFTWSWITWKYRSSMDFMYLWGANYWGTDPYTDLVTGSSYPNGDGVMIYPGKPIGITGPVDSLRTLMARRGLQDKEYLTMLEKLGQGAYAQQQADQLIPYALTEARVYGTHWSYKAQSWSDNPDVWNTTRRNLANKILEVATSGTNMTPPMAPTGLIVD
jgi:hypothetical protein